MFMTHVMSCLGQGHVTLMSTQSSKVLPKLHTQNTEKYEHNMGVYLDLLGGPVPVDAGLVTGLHVGMVWLG